MRKFEKLILTGCGYTVLILTIFYTIIALTRGFKTPAISSSLFALILTSGFAITGAELMYNTLKLNKALRCIVHYLVLLVVFLLIFIVYGKMITGNSSNIFVAIVVYTLLYFPMWFITHLIKKTISFADDKIEKKTKASSKGVKNQKSEYKPLYKSGK